MHTKFARLVLLAFVSASTLSAAACGGGNGSGADTDASAGTDLESRARAIHERVISIDTHDDIPLDFATPDVDPGVRDGRDVTLPKMREGGLDVAFFVVYVGQRERTEENYERAKADALTKFEAIRRLTDDMYPEEIGFAFTPDDVERLYADGKLVATIGIENGFAIGQDLSLLEKYHELGARYFGLTHIGHNDIADSSIPRDGLGDEEEEHGGVSEFGEQVIAEANRLGIMVDVSHASRNTLLDAVRLSRAPIIASHSAVRELADTPRNLTDQEWEELAQNGGVIQIVAFDSYVKIPSAQKQAARRELRERIGIESFRSATDQQIADFRAGMKEINERFPGATVADLADHIDYAVNLIGIDHVGISSDFDGGGGVTGWDDASETFNVTLELVRRGYSEEEIGKLWGGNLLRVWREVEDVAAEMGGR
jgi:membrane dipeptidase